MRHIVLAALLIAPLVTSGQEPDYLHGIGHYKPQTSVSGTIRIWGNNYIPSLMQSWQTGFRKYHPEIRFETSLRGTEAAMAGLYGNIADIVFLGREAYPSEVHAFRERFGYDPLGIEISSGSFSTPHKTFALMVYVHKENPIAGLTMEQLRDIFGCACSTKKQIRTWSELGLTGDWASRPLQVYGYAPSTGMAAYFDRVVLHGSGKWSESLKDFDNGRDADGEVVNAGVYVLRALATDSNGIAYANVLYQNDQVRAVPISLGAEMPFVDPTKATAWSRQYPITRFTTVYVNRKPGIRLDFRIKEFIRYILSAEGTQATVEDGAYLPLNHQLIDEQLKKLE